MPTLTTKKSNNFTQNLRSGAFSFQIRSTKSSLIALFLKTPKKNPRHTVAGIFFIPIIPKSAIRNPQSTIRNSNAPPANSPQYSFPLPQAHQAVKRYASNRLQSVSPVQLPVYTHQTPIRRVPAWSFGFGACVQ